MTTHGSGTQLGQRCTALLSARGEASGVALAQRILDAYEQLSDADRTDFFAVLCESFDPDPALIVEKAVAHHELRSAASLAELLRVAEPPRQEVFRRLNQAPGGTGRLVRMREDLLARRSASPELARVDDDLRHLFTSWFNRGFLVLESITWATSARLLERIIEYEAVHEIQDWHDLRRRIEPSDRRCYAFMHPALPDEPLIFVEVALTHGTPDTIVDLLADQRTPIAADDADTRGVLFDLELPARPPRCVVRSLPHQAGRSRAWPCPPRTRHVRDPLTGPGSHAVDPLDGDKRKLTGP